MSEFAANLDHWAHWNQSVKMAEHTTLKEYFGSKQPDALRAYAQFATGTAWSIEHKMELYCSAQTAFANGSNPAASLAAFENVYHALSSAWQVFRPVGAANCWSAAKILRELRTRMDAFGRSSNIDLSNLNQNGRREQLVKAIRPLGGIKAKKNSRFPLMTVSKFLHFYNPTLFPIYDGAVIENEVLNYFWDDFGAFCETENLNQNEKDGAEFFGNYVCFASDLISNRSTKFMEDFAGWLRDEIAPRKFRAYVSINLNSLFATAFEFTLIGAYQAEQSSKQLKNR